MEDLVRVYRPYFRMAGWLVLIVLAWYVVSQSISAVNAPMIQVKDKKTDISLTGPGGAAKPAGKSGVAAPETEKRIGVVKVVVSPALNIRSKASSRGKLVGSAPQGSKLSVLARADGWYEIIDAKGKRGFVSAGRRFVSTVWMKKG